MRFLPPRRGQATDLDKAAVALRCQHLTKDNRGEALLRGFRRVFRPFQRAASDEPWEKDADDICFIHLPPNLLGNLKKDRVFLDGP